MGSPKVNLKRRQMVLVVLGAIGIMGVLVGLRNGTTSEPGYLSSSVFGGSEPVENYPYNENEFVSTTLKFYYGNINWLTKGPLSANTHVIALHGPRRTQNALHWMPSIDTLSQMGTCHLVNIEGFGNSTLNTKIHGIPNFVGALGLQKILENIGVLDDPTKQLVFVARSWGAHVALQLLRQYPEIGRKPVRFVFITPSPKLEEVPDTQREYFKNARGIVLWGKWDKVFPPNYPKVMRSLFSGLDFKWLSVSSHQPEIDNVKVFADVVSTWWAEEKQTLPLQSA